ncbi:MAG: hypothetical protein EOO52_15515 [Gammaproteobacteria bacterium]|nr:MAG: hypothetical protein EOO52_15515 [Gammaproteobacteria bacterium]
MSSNFFNSFISRMSRNFFGFYLLAAVFVIVLTGCGGGDASKAATENNLPSPVAGGIDGGVLVPGDTGESPIPPSSLDSLPQVSVGPRQFADPNVLLNLRGSAVAASGSQIVKTLWTQVTGPDVVIPAPESLDNIILVPDVNLATQLEFRLTAQDSEGRINSATISILVKPVPTFVKVIGGVFNEANEKAVFKIRLNAPSTSPVSVSYITQDGTANSGSRDEGLDYVAASGEIIFAAGEVLKEIPITLVNDVDEEDSETFSLQVTAIDGTATHANTGVAIIRNGTEPNLSQSLQFSESGPITIYLGEQYNNNLSSAGEGTGDIIYSSSDTSVATVNAQGLVTSLAIGTTTITATKFADDQYLSASTSYNLDVISRGYAPSVSILAPNERENPDGYSVQVGDTVYLQGVAFDREDGELPTQAQLDASEKTGEPITSLTWISDIDGFLSYGDTLETNKLSRGTHEISYAATDSSGNTTIASTRVLVGNIAPWASAEASSTFCPDVEDLADCYHSYNVNDTSLSHDLGGLQSWVNDDSSDIKLPQVMSLVWWQNVTVDSVDIYMTKDYVMQDYDIEYSDGEGWFTLASVTGNTQLVRSHAVSNVAVRELRVVVKKGSVTQPQYARINEIVVFGTMSRGG